MTIVMTELFDGPKIDVVAACGVLSVTIRPRRHWRAALVGLGFDVILAVVLYKLWPVTPLSIRVFWLALLPFIVWNSAYEFLGQETVEIDSQKLTIRKGIHGWERKRKYQIGECSNLEWKAGRKGKPHLTCRVRRWPIAFAKGLSKAEADKIFLALQQILPDVAQKICAATGNKEHFITLGLHDTERKPNGASS
jgi:hypothetical protein